jgi:hypothetical protein
MITIQEAHKYLNLSNEGLVKKIKCSNDNDHPDLVSWIGDNDEVIFMCLACSFKIRPGLSMVNYIKSVNKKFMN